MAKINRPCGGGGVPIFSFFQRNSIFFHCCTFDNGWSLFSGQIGCAARRVDGPDYLAGRSMARNDRRTKKEKMTLLEWTTASRFESAGPNSLSWTSSFSFLCSCCCSLSAVGIIDSFIEQQTTLLLFRLVIRLSMSFSIGRS